MGCIHCQACCKWGHAVLSDEDISKVSIYIGISEASFKLSFLDFELSKEYGINILKSSLHDGSGCVFLTKNGCSIYDARPSKCRTFPRKEHIDDELKRICEMSVIIEKMNTQLECEISKRKKTISEITYRNAGDYFYGLNHRTNQYVELNELSYFIFTEIQNGTFNIETICNDYDIDQLTAISDCIDLIKSIDSSCNILKQDFSNTAENDILRKLADKKIPASVTIEITERCNERCIHCYRPDYIKNEYWNLKNFEYLCLSLKGMGVIQLDITGGEPFLKKDIGSYIEVASSHGFIVTILTNGTLINDGHIKQLLKTKIRNIYVSIYSSDDRIHDSITRHRGSLKKTLSSIAMLKRAGIPVCINAPIMTTNKNSPEGIKDIANKLGCDVKFTYKISSSYSGSRNSVSLNAYSHELLASAMKNEKIKLYSDIVNDEFRKKELDRDTYCDAGNRSMAISPHGDIMICTALRMVCGNLKSKKIKEIWDNSLQLTEWRNKHIKINKKCKGCKRINYCEPCPAWFYNETGELNGIDNNTCEFGHSFYDAVISLNTDS